MAKDFGDGVWSAAGNRSGSISRGKIPRGPWGTIWDMVKFALFLPAPSVLRPIAYEDASPFRIRVVYAPYSMPLGLRNAEHWFLVYTLNYSKDLYRK